MPYTPPPGSFGCSGAKVASAPGASAAVFAAARGGGSFHGGGLRGGSLSRLGGSVRGGRKDYCAIDRADLQHAESPVCEPTLAQVAPGLGYLSERHGEGAAVKGPELSSQAIGLFHLPPSAR